MKKLYTTVFIALFLIGFCGRLQAQPALEKDYSFTMKIPSVVTMGSSPAHLYVLSDTEGMAVFRTNPDTLQWLYSSTGMEQRGNTMTADIRFAYLWGNSRRLTVLEPTSVLGVYSSTLLPSQPRDAKRIDQDLYVALGDKGLGRISLKTPASVDSTMDLVERSRLSSEIIIDLEASADQLFALSRNKLYKFDYRNQRLSLAREFNLSDELNGIYLLNRTLYGSNSDGDIFEISGSGEFSKLGSIGEPVTKIASWKDWLIIKGKSHRLWSSYQNRSPELWKASRDAGNFFTVSKGDLWLCEYNQLNRITATKQTLARSQESPRPRSANSFNMKNISDQTVPHSKPLLLPLRLQGPQEGPLQFAYQSPDIKNAEVRGKSFLWQPTSDDIGTHRVKIVATGGSGQTDSTSFKINVRSFNAPPRFAPVRPISIPVGEKFTLPIKAIDPDGMSQNLIRFLGVNLPNGASINERTGTFTWTPGARQVGTNEFRVIATDQYGAAQSADISIRVIENLKRGNSGS